MSYETDILDICRRVFQRPRPDGSLPRQFHDHAHASVRAVLTVEPPADASLRHGLFARPGRYPAVIRFSKGFFEGGEPDVCGMAIKVSGVEGDVCEGALPGQQDFVLMDQPTFLVPGAPDMAAVFAELDGDGPMTMMKLAAPRYVFPRGRPWRVRWGYPKALMSIAWADLTGGGLARRTYHSATPYRLGDGAVKYLFRPDAATRRIAGGRRKPGPGLQAALDRGPVGFDFLIRQRRGDAEPIDDATVAWKGPAVRVGRLEIPPQRVEDSFALGERLAFSPWNCLAAHEPLGDINALRRAAYRASAEARGGDARCPFSAGDENPADC